MTTVSTGLDPKQAVLVEQARNVAAKKSAEEASAARREQELLVLLASTEPAARPNSSRFLSIRLPVGVRYDKQQLPDLVREPLRAPIPRPRQISSSADGRNMKLHLKGGASIEMRPVNNNEQRLVLTPGNGVEISQLGAVAAKIVLTTLQQGGGMTPAMWSQLVNMNPKHPAMLQKLTELCARTPGINAVRTLNPAQQGPGGMPSVAAGPRPPAAASTDPSKAVNPAAPPQVGLPPAVVARKLDAAEEEKEKKRRYPSPYDRHNLAQTPTPRPDK